MKVGLLCCFYDCADLLEKVVGPWLSLDNIEIAVVHGQFKEYHEMGVADNDKDTLLYLKNTNFYNFLYSQNDYWLKNPEEYIYQSEAEIRDKGLQYLLTKDVDYIWLLDGDEVYKREEILKTLDYINSEPFFTWFSIEFRNLTFSEETYTKGFRPPRIFKVNLRNHKLYKCYWDNDFEYKDNEGNINSYAAFASKPVPESICNPLHYTWLDNERSRKKIEYQEKHFKHGAGCSFKWGVNGLEWNEEYFRKTGFFKPELYNI